MRDWITLTNIGGGRPRPLRTSGVSAGWSVTSQSTASVEVLARDLLSVGLMRPKGKWFFWSDQDAGAFNGIISDAQPNGDETVELAIEDWRRCFNKRRLPRSGETMTGFAGALALRAISTAQHDDYLWIEQMSADEGGDPIELAFDGGDLRQTLDELASRSEQEYAVDPVSRDFVWRYRLGVDRSRTVELRLGRHITAYSLPDSIDPMVNDLLAVPSNELYARTQAVAVFDDDSIATYGRQQGSRDYLVGVTESALRPVATADVQRLARLGASIEATIVNQDLCWSWFREGDSIGLLLPNISSRLTARVMARALDTSSQTMRISASVETWRVYDGT